MSYKTYDRTFFDASMADGTDYVFICTTQNTRYGFRHLCHHDGLQVAKVCYYNRTWERFRYETVLRKAIENMPKCHQQELKSILIDGHVFGSW